MITTVLSRACAVRTKILMVLGAVLVVAGSILLGTTISAFAATGLTGTLMASPSSGLSNGSVVTLTGTGFTDSSIGNVLECNSDPNQPTVMDGGVIDSAISVSCSAPSLSMLVTTSATGTVSTKFTVVQGTVGPPCGAAPAAVTCPATDSAGKSPTADAALYPCPPTAAQIAIGDTCQLNYGDEANDSGVVNLSFGSTTSPSSSSTTSTTTATPSSSSTTSTTTATPSSSSTSTTSTTTATPTSSSTTSTTTATPTSSSTTSTTTATPTSSSTTSTTTATPTSTTSTTPPTAVTGAYELYCPGTPVGDIVLNDAVTSATLSPAAPTAGQSFSVTGYQTMVAIPASLAGAAAAIQPNLEGTATAQIDASGATPATTPEGPLDFNVTIPSPIPSAGVPLSLPSTPATISGFTATSPNITIQEDSAASLSLTVSGSALALTCTAYPNDSVTPSGIVTSAPTATPISPVIAVAGGGSSATTVPSTPTTKAPTPGGTPTTAPGSLVVTKPSSSLAFTGAGPGIGMLSITGGALILLGFALLVLVDAPRRAVAQLATVSLTKWREVAASDQRWRTLASEISTNGRRSVHSGMRIAKQTAGWLLGR